jgi:hypothetical protein
MKPDLVLRQVTTGGIHEVALGPKSANRIAGSSPCRRLCIDPK